VTLRASIVLPVFNGEARIADALDRLARQDAEDFEIVVVDDGSSDRTLEIANERADRDDRIRVVRAAENGGVARARRLGVETALGEYVWFVDIDDGWPDHALRTLLGSTDAGVDVVVAGAVFSYASGARRPLVPPSGPPASGREALELLFTGRITGHLWNKLFRRDLMAKASFAPARLQSDLVMTADALSFAGRVVFRADQVYEYRIRGGSLITTPTQRRESLAIIENAVRADAERTGLASSDAYRCFVLRYIVLSGLKDAVLAPYDPAERARLIAAARARITRRELALLVRMRDPQRLALALTGRFSLPVYRRLLRIADRH